jgi:hypothetical protein
MFFIASSLAATAGFLGGLTAGGALLAGAACTSKACSCMRGGRNQDRDQNRELR